MKTSDHHILEAVGFHTCPILDLVAGNILHIAGHVVGSVGVGALATEGCHHLVVFVGNVVFGSQLRHRVDLVVGLLALCWVGKCAIFLIACLDVVEIGLFLCQIRGAEMGRSLKHQVLQVVGQAGGLRRVVARTRADGNVGLDARFCPVHRKVDFQAVVEGVDTCLHGIAFHRSVGVILGSHS